MQMSLLPGTGCAGDRVASGHLAQLRRERQAHLERLEGVMSVPVEAWGGGKREAGGEARLEVS